MFVSLVQGPLPRLVLVGMLLLALQQTLFVDVRPWGVTIQVMLALAAAAGVAGGPQKGALAGFVFGLLYDLRAGTPLGSSSFSMGIGGFTAGYVQSITIDPQWWLSALFVGLGTAVGEMLVPVVRTFVGEAAPVVGALVHRRRRRHRGGDAGQPAARPARPLVRQGQEDRLDQGQGNRTT